MAITAGIQDDHVQQNIMADISVANQSGDVIFAAVPSDNGGNSGFFRIDDGQSETWSSAGDRVAFVWKGGLVTGGTPDAHVVVSGETLVVA
jgi:hypothetical protein